MNLTPLAVNCINAFTGTIFVLAGADPASGNLGFAATQVFVVSLGSAWFDPPHPPTPTLARPVP